MDKQKKLELIDKALQVASSVCDQLAEETRLLSAATCAAAGVTLGLLCYKKHLEKK